MRRLAVASRLSAACLEMKLIQTLLILTGRLRAPLFAGVSVFLGVALVAGELSAEDRDRAALMAQFSERIVPLVEAGCVACHDSETSEAGLDLSTYQTMQQVVEGYPVWATVLERVEAGEMPPADSGIELSDAQRGELVQWIRALIDAEAARLDGDPGPVLARRLSNAEYDYSIRELTGVDIQPTSTFPVDPANEAGFDNSGESLAMSPALMQKYLEAARTVAEHLVLTPSGIRFAPHAVMTDTDRDKYCVNRIVNFYYDQPTDYADYLVACWQLQAGADEPSDQRLSAIASQHEISPKYLSVVWEALTGDTYAMGPMAEVQAGWQRLQEQATQVEAEKVAEQVTEQIRQTRREYEPHFENLHVSGVHNGSQTFVLWKNNQYAAHRRLPASEALGKIEDPAERESVERFCAVFPDAFYISERGRDYLGTPREKQEKGRLLSAGFHSMMGYFRDDRPLYELVLNERQQQELDTLWRELDFVTSAPMRQYQGFLWFERTDSPYMRDPEFDFARPENLAALREDQIAKLAEVYVSKAKRNGGAGEPLEAIATYFRDINRQIRWVEDTRAEVESLHLDAIVEFAGRAYRRPLHEEERQQLRAFYESVRADAELSHEEAIQDTLVMVLVSPYFCYRWDLLSDTPEERALSDLELASRLSYFLWAAPPDAELLALAEQGVLGDPQVIQSQVARMLQDGRVRGLVTEFGGNWLDFRRFEQHNSVDRQRFPQFDDELRSAMFAEPVHFLERLIQEERSLLDCLYGDWTVVNRPLAAHYGMTDYEDVPEGQWVRIDQAERYGRGGLLPMAVFLTQNSPGLRTSPVKRGYWVVRRLLGERIPAPPPNVPELPSDEAALGELTLREALAKHREHPSCAGCHNRFDSIGLVFEGFGPVGERRALDLGGRAVDAAAEFPDGSQRVGVGELKDYLRDRREAEFIDNICRKLLSYALGRTLILSDEPLVKKIATQAQASDFKFRSLVEAIVTSHQFTHKRGSVEAAMAASLTD